MELTKSEEQIMQHLWRLKKAFVAEIIAEMPEPKPAYNTVSTIIRILEKKNVVGYTAFGKSHQYYPLVSEETYKRFSGKQLLENYFNNSVASFVSFFAENNNLSLQEIEQLKKLIERNAD
ncbi:MAG: BlaI/MecI/CopY family transcriptional regulator [Luteibaculaceae bacterium]